MFEVFHLDKKIFRIPVKLKNYMTIFTLPKGQVPNHNRLGCVPCPLHQIVTDGKCQDCLKPGEIPLANRLRCFSCNSNEFTKNGSCQKCPTGEVPTTDRLRCFACNVTSITVNGMCTGQVFSNSEEIFKLISKNVLIQ